MVNIDMNTAIKNSFQNKTGRKFPDSQDGRVREGLLFPEFKPSFYINQGACIFTIGSCFARNIEEALTPLGFEVPTLSFRAPMTEWPARPNGLLNEYNPGTISQRILFALEGKKAPEDTIIPGRNLFVDLLLPGGAGVSKERAIERRDDIYRVYTRLATSPYVVITLGLVEAWFDNETNVFLNRTPPRSYKVTSPHRFSLKVLDEESCYRMLEKAISSLHDNGSKVILTVSPVPLRSTFTDSDCVIANEYSKSVLRACAERLWRKFTSVDYYPSYEIVRSGGLSHFRDDYVHVKNEVVITITKHMIERYSKMP